MEEDSRQQQQLQPIDAAQVASMLNCGDDHQCMNLQLHDDGDDGLDSHARPIELFVFCVDVFFQTLMGRFPSSSQEQGGGGGGMDVSEITEDRLRDVVKAMRRAGIQTSLDLSPQAASGRDTLDMALHADGWSGEWHDAPVDLPVASYYVDCLLKDMRCILRFRPDVPKCYG